MDALQGAIDVDTNIFFSINRMHNMYFDYFMSAYSGKWVWIPMYAATRHVPLGYVPMWSVCVLLI